MSRRMTLAVVWKAIFSVMLPPYIPLDSCIKIPFLSPFRRTTVTQIKHLSRSFPLICSGLSNRHVNPTSKPTEAAQYSGRARFPLPWRWRHAAARAKHRAGAHGRRVRRITRRRRLPPPFSHSQTVQRVAGRGQSSRSSTQTPSTASPVPSWDTATPQRQDAWDCAPSGRAVRKPDWCQSKKNVRTRRVS